MHKAISLLFLLGTVLAQVAAAAPPERFEVAERWDIGRVPAGFPVRFGLLTGEERQYVAYYNEKRRMTVASRTLGSDQWQYQVLPTKVGWDSHNYITMALDDDGHLHVTGNMHNVKLIYFRTEKVGDITSLKRFPMTGQQENRATYPKFLTDHEGSLIFNYRNGSSGNGMRLWNKYDVAKKQWSRLLEEPLLDGQGKRNAYPRGPVRGPDGWFHLVWVWRDTSDCATNNHLSHARSRNLEDWESVFGEKIELPMTLGDQATWVDPIPSGGGIINGCQKLFFDAKNRPVITYHKSDPDGNMQIYAARPEGGTWVRRVLTDWKKPIHFSGGGSMGFIGIRIGELSRPEPGVLTMSYRHRDYGSGRLVIDEESLRPIRKRVSVPRPYPKELSRVESDFEGMGIIRAEDLAENTDGKVRYVLQWETLGSNRDRPRKPPLPEPSMLRLYKLVAE